MKKALVLLVTLMAGILYSSSVGAAPKSSTGSWSLTARMPEGRKLHTATLLKDGRVLVAGGCIQGKAAEQKCPSPTAVVYDPAANKWTPTGKMSAGHMYHTASLLSDGRVLVAAGCTASAGKEGCPSKVSEIYDPATNKWKMAKELDVAQANHAAAVLPDGPREICGDNCGKVLLVGSVSNPTELYDPRKDTWQVVEGPKDDVNASATTLKNGNVLIVGGLDAMYSPLTGKVAKLKAAPPVTRLFHSATPLPDGSVLVAGGLTFPDQNASSNRADLYVPGADPSDPAGGSWRPVKNLYSARLNHRSALLQDGRVLVVGGRPPVVLNHDGSAPVPPSPGAPPQPSLGAKSELFDPKSDSWIQGPDTLAFHGPGPEPQPYLQSHIAVTPLKDGRAMVVGGVTNDAGKNIPQAVSEIFTPASLKIPSASSGLSGKGLLSGRPAWQLAAAGAAALALLIALVWAVRRRRS